MLQENTPSTNLKNVCLQTLRDVITHWNHFCGHSSTYLFYSNSRGIMKRVFGLEHTLEIRKEGK